KGNPLPLRPEHLLSDTGDARFVFSLKGIPAKGRQILWLYYGNPKAEAGPLLELEKSPNQLKEVVVSLGAEESMEPAALAKETSLNQWLKEHNLIEAESGRREGFTVRPPNRDTQLMSGSVIVASGGTADKVSFDLDLEPRKQESDAPRRNRGARRSRSESEQV